MSDEHKQQDAAERSGGTACSTAVDDAAVRADRMRVRRGILGMSPRERQRSVCRFPLEVANTAQDMKRMIDILDSGVESNGEIEEAIEFLESTIRDHFRNLFGREMTQ